MSCSADYYFIIFMFGLVAPTIILCGMYTLAPPPPHHLVLCYTRYCYALCGWHTLPYVSSELINHKKCAKIFFCNIGSTY